MKMRVGFIGLGLMGKPMALNIFKAGFSLVVYNRNQVKTEAFKKLRVDVANSPLELAQKTDVVITMVTAPKDVEEVLFGDNGLTKSKKQDLIIIDMSTIGPTAARAIGKKLYEKNMVFVDAPVTGGVVRATSGELTIFVGADTAIYEKVKPILLAMGTTLHHMGSVGSGQAIKLVNNYFVGVEMVALSEGMMLADSMGLSRQKAAEVLQSAATGMSPIMKLVIENFATHTFPIIFSLSNMHKDIVLAMSEVTGKNLPMMRLTRGIFDRGMSAGMGNEDLSAIIKIIQKEEIQ